MTWWPVEQCLITHWLLDELWGALDIEFEGMRSIALRAGINTEEQLLFMEGAGTEVPELEVDLPISCVYQNEAEELVVMAGSSHFHEKLGGRSYQVSAPSFFQVNSEQAERLMQTTLDYLDPKPGEHFLDAFCGVGTFTLSIAPHAAGVLGIESSPWAINDALVNLEEGGSGGAEVDFIEGGVEEVLAEMDEPFDGCGARPPPAPVAPCRRCRL